MTHDTNYHHTRLSPSQKGFIFNNYQTMSMRDMMSALHISHKTLKHFMTSFNLQNKKS